MGRKPKISEASILKSVLDYLAAKRIVHVRIHPVRPIGKQGAIRFVRVPDAMLGCADIIALHKGLAYGLEIKNSAGGVQSEHQKRWAERWVGSGGVYAIIRNVDDLAVYF